MNRPNSWLYGSTADVWTELLEARDADVVASYTDGPLPGTPALTRRALGEGAAWYLATWLDDEATAALADRLTREAGVTRLDAPQPGLEVVRRGRYLFVLNRGDLPASVPATGVDLLTGGRADGELRVAARAAAVIRSDEG